VTASKYDIKLDLERTPGSSHVFLVEMVGANKRVLDIGCDTGYLGETLNAFGNVTSGFEINEASAQVARQRLARVEVGDLENLDLAQVFDGQQFDVVVFGDVLEHLRDPLPTLRQARALVAPGGSVLISTPNVAHGDVRLALLQGRFDYSNLGILDETHTRFFTTKTLTEFIHSAGFAIVELRRTMTPLFGTEIGVHEEDCDPDLVATLREDREATTYQFVIRVVPDDMAQITSEQGLKVDTLTGELEAERRRIHELATRQTALATRVEELTAELSARATRVEELETHPIEQNSPTTIRSLLGHLRSRAAKN